MEENNADSLIIINISVPSDDVAMAISKELVSS